ncbi:hypothetical protein IB262_33255 [Ensifer sp. ENS02]|uniref:hypothetical protein n=1 Tax=Ensifer sp. ENS02 TaxID=2769290 RepID=UPI00177EA41C|nr:hypothetical protein [Ensifer sp. ENS02]MBD9524746.1 hypothetical protein [Ensifer sp. ENS02]
MTRLWTPSRIRRTLAGRQRRPSRATRASVGAPGFIASRGVEVKGYQPTEQDKLRAEQLGKQTGHAITIEKNETLEAYRATRDGTPKDKRVAAEKHPELGNAFAFEQAARSFAQQRLAKNDQVRFVDQARAIVERDLAQGKAVPEVRQRLDAERRQGRGLER